MVVETIVTEVPRRTGQERSEFRILTVTSFEINAQTCKPSGGIRGKKPPPGQCNRENDSDCCVQGKNSESMHSFIKEEDQVA
ncbi:hypothetical protein Ccrd_000720 [Cynara cardunculus var. scolymus]|uniref:Uncharacterized protein n=1 Tax=Cynara cardunculus var. scolymus TaxID=59895 RepID=A0A118JY99_CYNCS|nr:hypothetical protein Ccrd_000720 [Cynara cardunculus var. scolymus]